MISPPATFFFLPDQKNISPSFTSSPMAVSSSGVRPVSSNKQSYPLLQGSISARKTARLRDLEILAMLRAELVVVVVTPLVALLNPPLTSSATAACTFMT
jgi:hypothetical protein